MLVWIETARTTLNQAVVHALRANVACNRSNLTPFRLPKIAEQIVTSLIAFAASRDLGPLRALGERLGEQGLSLRSLLAAVRALTREALQRPLNPEDDRQQLLSYIEDFSDLLIETLADWEVGDVVRQRDEMQAAAELAARERESDLKEVIHELSAPIMPVYDRVLVLPLVGGIDDQRAREITEVLLEEVTRRKAAIVILDVTGLGAVDITSAAALVRTAKAVRLLGARTLLVGVRPEIACMLVETDVDLAGLTTLTNLQIAIEWAIRERGMVIQRRETERNGDHGH